MKCTASDFSHIKPLLKVYCQNYKEFFWHQKRSENLDRTANEIPAKFSRPLHFSWNTFLKEHSSYLYIFWPNLQKKIFLITPWANSIFTRIWKCNFWQKTTWTVNTDRSAFDKKWRIVPNQGQLLNIIIGIVQKV